MVQLPFFPSIWYCPVEGLNYGLQGVVRWLSIYLSIHGAVRCRQKSVEQHMQVWGGGGWMEASGGTRAEARGRGRGGCHKGATCSVAWRAWKLKLREVGTHLALLHAMLAILRSQEIVLNAS